MSCLDDNALADYLSGKLSADALVLAEAHLEACEACRELLAWSARATPRGPDTDPEMPRALRRGDTVGRYLLLAPLGRGAMGIVWSAYDPELERKVAVKVVQPDGPDPSRPDSDQKQRARLVREAQALARVSHPNVIAVFDVGTVDDQIFIAMELVHGSTLSEWLRKERRTLVEILDVFHQAGRGLSAAHTAGLVHRDFKPANVLVGDDGRVRVLDFGLARTEEAVHVTPLPGFAHRRNLISITNMLVGTPAYMAPEQRLGLRPDARADQYSFCVALVEGIVGERPTHDEDPVLRDRRLSAWLQKIVTRGLATEPEDRFASMDELLGAIERDPAARRRRRLGAVAAIAIVLVGGASLRYALTTRADRCAEGERGLTLVWNEAKRAALSAHFRASGLPYAETALSSTLTVIDRYTHEWMTMHRDACAATQVRGEQSEALLDLRMSCLADRVKSLEAVTELLTSADATSLRNAVAVAGGLAPLDSCGDAIALRGVVPPPRDEATRRQITALVERVAAAEALELAGLYDRAVTAIDAVLPSVRALDYPPLLAEALRVRGGIDDEVGKLADAEREMLEAGVAAEKGRDDRAAVRIRLELSYLARAMGKMPEATQWNDFAMAALSRVGADPLLRARVHDSRCAIVEGLGQWDEAIRECSAGLALRESALGPTDRAVGVSLVNLGVIAHDEGKTEQALAYYQRAFSVLEGTLGPTHPDLGVVMRDLGNTYSDLGRYTEGVDWLQRALQLSERTFGPTHRTVAASHQALGELLLKTGELDRALVEERTALRLGELIYEPDHPWLAWPLVKLAEIDLAKGAPLDALPLLERAMRLPPRKRAARPEVTYPLARALWLTDRDRSRAQRLFAEARAAYDPKVPADRQMLAEIDAWAAAHPPIVEKRP